MNILTQRKTAAVAIAKLLDGAGIQLDHEYDGNVITKAIAPKLRTQIVAAYRDAFNSDVEVTVNLSELPAVNYDASLLISNKCFEEIEKHLSEDIDYELWNLQCIAKADRRDSAVILRAQVAA